MRLKQPGNIDSAIQNIRNLASQLENTRSVVPDARYDAMLQWFEDQAGPVLEFLLDPAEDIISDVDAAYNRLVMVPLAGDRRGSTACSTASTRAGSGGCVRWRPSWSSRS